MTCEDEPLLDLGDGITLSTAIINHPITALGCRFSFRGAVFCTVYDTEPFRKLFVTDPEHPSYDELMALEGEEAAPEQHQVLQEFFTGADLLVHDAQYTRAAYDKGQIGWGHSPIEDAIASARRAGVKQLALFHHDPERSDAQLDAMTQVYCDEDGVDTMRIFFAREGQEIIL